MKKYGEKKILVLFPESSGFGLPNKHKWVMVLMSTEETKRKQRGKHYLGLAHVEAHLARESL